MKAERNFMSKDKAIKKNLGSGDMNDSKIKRPLDTLLECHDALLKDYDTSDRKSFRRHIVSLLENTFGLLAALYGYDPWEHYLTGSSPDLNDSGLNKILQAINDLKEHQQEWETPVVKNDDGFRYGDGPRLSGRWRTTRPSRSGGDYHGSCHPGSGNAF